MNKTLNTASKPPRTVPSFGGSFYKILDCEGVEMPDNWAVKPRTYERVKILLDRLNKNGEYKPYTMTEK